MAKTPKRPVTSGSGQVIKRGADGKLAATRKPDYAGVSNQTMKADRKVAAGTGNSYFASGVAPRVGGTAKPAAGNKINYGNSSIISKNSKLKKK